MSRTSMFSVFFVLYSSADKVQCVIGEQMYKQSRDQLKEMFGANSGIRLFSQLQKDKQRVSLSYICNSGHTLV